MFYIASKPIISIKKRAGAFFIDWIGLLVISYTQEESKRFLV